jgi:LPPG:FO 2-phospho-L-lactate transferase
MLASLGHESSALGVARIYAGLIDLFVVDEADAGLSAGIAGLGIRPATANAVMTDDASRAALARRVIEVAAERSPAIVLPRARGGS